MNMSQKDADSTESQMILTIVLKRKQKRWKAYYMNQKNKDIKEVVEHIKDLLEESERVSENAASGYDEGWFSGEINAYTNILDYLEDQEDSYEK